ncbi:MAG: roadblock/LC7 domain-containing protein [Candidatus Bathyarchaeia archaeon]
MTKKKKSLEETATAETLVQPIAIETATIEDLKTRLEEIKGYEGVIGYILRNATSATIDLKDPTKLIEYAILSSSALDAAEELSELFSLGDFRDILVEGRDTKILSLTIGENRISIFLEKNADIEKPLKKLQF